MDFKKTLILSAIALLSVTNSQARNFPTESEVNLDFHKSTFRELITDCTERSKSLSCHRAGVYYIKVRADYTNGIRYLNNSCELGRGYSCTLIGDYYRDGLIVKKDLIKAKDYYNKGCLRNSESGCKKFTQIILVPEKKKKWVSPLDMMNPMREDSDY